jgi:sugar/nucleoside kinase (ribokinase family)
MSGPQVAVLGPATIDELELEDGTRVTRPGGTPHYAARALRAEGAEVVVIETGRFLSRVRHTAAGTEQSILSLPEPLLADAARRLLPQLAGCSWVLLGGQTAGDFPPETIAVLAGAGLSLFLDGQGLARGSRVGAVELGPIEQAAPQVQALKLNAREAAAAGKVEVPELLVTHAEEGCDVVVADVRTRVPGSGRRFADPTGAGDSFGALYCLARARGAPPADAAGWAQAEVEQLYEQA